MTIKLSIYFVVGLTLLVSYLLGCFNGSVVTSHFIIRDDVRKHGSGNAGLTNFYRTYGAKFALIVILCDMGKTLLSCLIGGYLMLCTNGSWTLGVLLGGLVDGRGGAIVGAGIGATVGVGATLHDAGDSYTSWAMEAAVGTAARRIPDKDSLHTVAVTSRGDPRSKEEAFAGLEAVFFQREAFPFGQRLYDLGFVIILFLDAESYGTLNPVQVIVQAGSRVYKKRRRYTQQVQPFCQQRLKEVLYRLNADLGIVEGKG